ATTPAQATAEAAASQATSATTHRLQESKRKLQAYLATSRGHEAEQTTSATPEASDDTNTWEDSDLQNRPRFSIFGPTTEQRTKDTPLKGEVSNSPKQQHGSSSTTTTPATTTTAAPTTTTTPALAAAAAPALGAARPPQRLRPQAKTAPQASKLASPAPPPAPPPSHLLQDQSQAALQAFIDGHDFEETSLKELLEATPAVHRLVVKEGKVDVKLGSVLASLVLRQRITKFTRLLYGVSK
ncbi:unnamed protein product, partial [Polarella glacialis]